MGRIRTQLIKRLTATLIAKHKSELKKDFKGNKEILLTLTDNPSKKLRNLLAGSVTNSMKREG